MIQQENSNNIDPIEHPLCLFEPLNEYEDLLKSSSENKLNDKSKARLLELRSAIYGALVRFGYLSVDTFKEYTDSKFKEHDVEKFSDAIKEFRLDFGEFEGKSSFIPPVMKKILKNSDYRIFDLGSGNWQFDFTNNNLDLSKEELEEVKSIIKPFMLSIANLVLRTSGIAEMGYEIVDATNNEKSKSLYGGFNIVRAYGTRNSSNGSEIGFQILFNNKPHKAILDIIKREISQTLFKEINGGIPCPVSGRVMNEIDLHNNDEAADVIRFAGQNIMPDQTNDDSKNICHGHADQYPIETLTANKTARSR